jgi:hypothetical protein
MVPAATILEATWDQAEGIIPQELDPVVMVPTGKVQTSARQVGKVPMSPPYPSRLPVFSWGLEDWLLEQAFEDAVPGHHHPTKA